MLAVAWFLFDCCSFRTEALHDSGDEYIYEFGVCVDVGKELYDGCGAVQYGKTNKNLTHCLGYLSSAQVARSKCVCV